MWIPIKHYEGLYSVNKKGQIKSEKRKKVDGRRTGGFLMKPSKSSTGYWGVNLTNKNGKIKRFHIHRLLAIHFIPNPNNYPCINHINGKKTDNRLKNLEWCDYSYNSKDSFKRGRKIWNKGLKGLQDWHNIEGIQGKPWNKGLRTKQEIKCKCGKIFYPPKKTSKFCSKSCASKGNQYGKKILRYL